MTDLAKAFDCYIPPSPPNEDAVWILTQKPADEEEAAVLDAMWEELLEERKRLCATR